ncbi:MAG: hypothetical protein P8R42_21655 [Candidatus Binatia bacterium]|nr:hypothetical protein [Candidatus Binatia bacterium]
MTELAPLRHRALRIGLLATIACIAGAIYDPEQAVRSYLIGYLFWLGIALGALAILAIHFLAGGAWSAVLRRPLEAATRTFPLLALLFLPLAAGTTTLYEWAHPGVMEHDPILAAKASYLNVPFFYLRAALYFSAWILLSFFLNRLSIAEDENADPKATQRLEMLGRGTLVVYGLTTTFASIDWVMSLEPHWFSMIFGLLIMGEQVLSAFTFAIPVLLYLRWRGWIGDVVKPQQMRDLGSFLLAFVMIWAYLSLSQLLIIWSANLPEEISWYLRRSTGGWKLLATALVLFHFAVPFFVLLSRNAKTHAVVLGGVALWILFGRWIELVLLIVPSYETTGFTLHPMDLATPVAVGGVWLWAYLGHLGRHPLIPRNDPSLSENSP